MCFGIGSDNSSRYSHELYAQWFSLFRESLDGGLGMGPMDDPVWLIFFFGCAASLYTVYFKYFFHIAQQLSSPFAYAAISPRITVLISAPFTERLIPKYLSPSRS
jgi:hypothetical protein